MNNRGDMGAKKEHYLTTRLKAKMVVDFYKKVYQVDGVVKILSKKTCKNFETIGVIELNDSKRGKFYIGGLKRKDKKWAQ